MKFKTVAVIIKASKGQKTSVYPCLKSCVYIKMDIINIFFFIKVEE